MALPSFCSLCWYLNRLMEPAAAFGVCWTMDVLKQVFVSLLFVPKPRGPIDHRAEEASHFFAT